MSEKEKHLVTLKEIELEHCVIKYKVDLKNVDFGIYVLWKEKPPAIVDLIADLKSLFIYEHPSEKGYAHEYYYGEGVVLTHLGCYIASKDEDIEKNREIVERNKEGLVKLYDDIFRDAIAFVKTINDNWDTLREINEKIKEIFGFEPRVKES